jgi:hypothetical protein
MWMIWIYWISPFSWALRAVRPPAAPRRQLARRNPPRGCRRSCASVGPPRLARSCLRASLALQPRC